MTRSAQVDIVELKEDEKAWVSVLNRFRALQSSEKTAVDLHENVIPPLEKQVIDDSLLLEKAQEGLEEVALLRKTPAYSCRRSSKFSTLELERVICRLSGGQRP